MLSQKQGSETSHGLVLCDASLVFAGRAGRGSHARLRLAGERAGVPDRLSHAAADLDGEAVRAARGEMLQRYRNRPGGFWCLQDDPAAARYAICGTEPLAGLDTVLAPTDGASRAYDLLEVMTPAGMIERARKGQLHEIAASVRSAEDDRLEDLARVGLKDHDDLTIVATKLPGAAVA